MSGNSQAAGFDAVRLQRITDQIERNYIEPQRLAGCQMAIHRRGREAYSRSFGSMDLAQGKPMREDAIFRLLSMTKQVTAVALMMLYERGLFQLNDPVSRWAPSWADLRVWVSGEGADMVTEPVRRPVTIRDLLTHMSGLIYAVGWPMVPVEHPVEKIYRELDVRVASSDDTMVGFLDKLAKAPLIHQPGAQWTYGVNIDACGALVEIISGKPFDKFLKDELFEPLGMADTAFYVPPEKADRFCTGYVLAPDMKLYPWPDDPTIGIFSHDPVYKAGGGGLVSTTADCVRFSEMLRRGGELNGQRILGPRTLEMMRTNHLPGGKGISELTTDPMFQGGYAGVGNGLGFMVRQGVVESAGMGSGSFGGAGAMTCSFWVDPREDMSVVFLTQLLPYDPYNLRQELNSLVYSAIAD